MLFSVKDTALNIQIAQSKIEKLHKRIDLYFGSFERDGNAILLYERIRYLTSKKRAVKHFWFISREQFLASHSKRIYFGPIETYKEVGTPNKVWKDLDLYIKRRVKEYRTKGLLNNKFMLRKLYSCSFERNALANNIYKIDNLTETDLTGILTAIDPTLNPTSLIHEKKHKLLQRYFEYVDIK